MKKICLFFVLCLLCLPHAAWGKDIQRLDFSGLTELVQKNKGKVILLNFFATWCPPCRAEIPHLVTAYEEYAGKDVLIVSLSIDDDARLVPPFVKDMGMDYPVYLIDRKVAAAYRISTIPHNVFYDRDGSLVASQSGVLDEESLMSVLAQLLQK